MCLVKTDPCLCCVVEACLPLHDCKSDMSFILNIYIHTHICIGGMHACHTIASREMRACSYWLADGHRAAAAAAKNLQSVLVGILSGVACQRRLACFFGREKPVLLQTSCANKYYFFVRLSHACHHGMAGCPAPRGQYWPHASGKS